MVHCNLELPFAVLFGTCFIRLELSFTVIFELPFAVTLGPPFIVFELSFTVIFWTPFNILELSFTVILEPPFIVCELVIVEHLFVDPAAGGAASGRLTDFTS